jgi:Zn-dependent membrane protease YugP
MFILDPLYIILIAPAFILSLVASYKVKSTFAKYSKIRSSQGYSGAEAAERMLRYEGIYDVVIEHVPGHLSDHYDPRTKTLRLSDSVYSSCSISAVGVACHEAGHALQDAKGYAALGLRTALVPGVSLFSNLAVPLILIGMLFHMMFLAKLGVIFFSGAVLFALVTLPVEWNASSRAKEIMFSSGILTMEERYSAGKVLNAAFMTYLAAALAALLQLIYFLLRTGLLGGGDD